MIKSSLVTVYVVNYNYGRYLEECLKSVFLQTYKNIEILLIDDGSTDQESKLILDKYEDDSRIFLIRQDNKGLTFSNNVALKNSTGKYIMRLDADDYLVDNCVEKLVKVLDNNSDYDLVFPDYYEISETGEIITQVCRHDFSKDVQLLDSPAHGACTLFRRDILLEVGGYDEEIKLQDGWDIWLKLFTKSKVTNVRKPLFYYRQHSKSLTKDETNMLKTRAQILKKHIELSTYKKIKTLAVLPVRGKGFDSINFALMKLGNKELICWSIDEAIKCESVDELLITSIDKELISFLESKYNNSKITFQLRDSNNSNKFESSSDLLLQIAKEKEEFEILVLLNQESPFRGNLYIDKAVNTCQVFDLDNVIAARQDDEIFFVHDGKGLVNRRPDVKKKLERDDLYRKVGGLTVIRRKSLLASGEILSGRIGHVILDQKSSLSIRTKFDWELAKLLVSKMQ